MTELTDQMRTCAAYIMSRPHDAPMPTEHLLDDAARLLIEASNLLEAPAPAQLLGDERRLYDVAKTIAHEAGMPWTDPRTLETIPPPPIPPLPYEQGLADAKARDQRTCPKCDSRTGKKVYREGKQLMLRCPVCGTTWAWKVKP